MKVVVFQTPEEQETGLQYRPAIEAGVAFVFPGIPPGVQFHSRNVAEPFDIAFLSRDGLVLLSGRMFPPYDVIRAPEGAEIAVEAKAGWLPHWGFLPGYKVRF